MSCFEENCCRLCTKTFCCEKCRLRHEEDFHKINPECEICVFGRTTIKTISVALFSHIRNTHWPLHCVFCKKIFASLDELVPHQKCTPKLEVCNMQTPKTPISEEKDEPSPEVTPFYKSLKVPLRAITSTPLVQKEEIDRNTPNQSQILVHKSNLKLTGSSNLTDSKKSERRVTFSETPSVSEIARKPKYLPLQRINDSAEEDLSDESYASVEEEFKTAPTNLEDMDNKENELVVFDKPSNGTLWESAHTRFDSSAETPSHINVSLQINVFNSTAQSDPSNINDSIHNKTTNLWTSMTKMVKSVVNNISFSSVSVKRPPAEDAVEPSLKRMKLTELKCRRPIRDLSPLCQIRLGRPRYVDKATQTDDCWM